MATTLFTHAGVVVLAGLMASAIAVGCSSSDPAVTSAVPDAGGGGTDAELDARQPPDTAGEETGTAHCPYTEPISAADIERQLTWLPPGPVQTACTQQDIDALKALYMTPPAGGVKAAQIKSALGATCAACAFSPITGSSWQLFIEDLSGFMIDNAAGSCFAQLESTGCGKTRFELDACLDASCPEVDCGYDAACKPNAQKGSCRELTDAYVKGCPDAATLLPICGNLFSALAVSCAGGADAGIDASTK